MSYKISVVVPVYNVEEYLEECIESIINQTYTNLEIILVDDGSTDNSGKICDKYSNIDNRIIVIHKENGGLVSARKAGVKISTGFYITFVDSDDWIDLNAYEYVLEKAGEHVPDIIAYGYKKHYSNTIIELYESLAEGLYNKAQKNELIMNYYKDDKIAFNHILFVSVWNKLFRAELVKVNIEKVNNSIIKGEDMALVIPSMLELNTIYIAKFTPYNYRMRDTSIMHTCKNNDLYRIILVIRRIFQAVFDNNLAEIPSIKKMAVSYSYYLLLLSNILDSFEGLGELYPEINRKSNILIYGNGVYGNNLKNLIIKEKKHEFLGFVDKTCINEISQYNNYDYIIIAITNSNLVMDSVDLLLKYGVSNDKILFLKNNNLSSGHIYKLLERF